MKSFWQHLYQKNVGERQRPLQFYACAIDLLIHSRCEPQVKIDPKQPSEILYRFGGAARDGGIFFVQVKEDR